MMPVPKEFLQDMPLEQPQWMPHVFAGRKSVLDQTEEVVSQIQEALSAIAEELKEIKLFISDKTKSGLFIPTPDEIKIYGGQS